MMTKHDIRNLLKTKLTRGDDMSKTCDICGRNIKELSDLNEDYAEITEKESGLSKCAKCDRENKVGQESEDKTEKHRQAVQGWKPEQSYY